MSISIKLLIIWFIFTVFAFGVFVGYELAIHSCIKEQTRLDKRLWGVYEY